MRVAQSVVELVDAMGSDLRVVNAARASFNKRSTWLHPPGPLTPGILAPRDASLIRYLADGVSLADLDRLSDELISCRDRAEARALIRRIRRIQTHFQPFAHVHLSFTIKAPLFVARQLWRSHVGSCGGDAGTPAWSEESRRYVDEEPEVFIPDGLWRSRAENVKQGSGGLANEAMQDLATEAASRATLQAVQSYTELLDGAGVAPEQARLVLPQNIMVTWDWSGTLLFFARVCLLRLDSHAQAETRDLAACIAELARPVAPVSWAALMGEGD